MWSDNDTEIDLLGFQVHSDLILNVVTRRTMLPVTIGLFGDWGSGKSSVMRMLRRDLELQEKVACVSFNGWQFEGYDDAKTALIQSVLEELKRNERFGPKVKNKVEDLLKRLNWFRLLSAGYQTFVAPVIASYIATLSGLPPALSTPKTDAVTELSINDIVNNHPANNVIQNVREFQEEFSELIEDTELDALVILIDDLDRCTPERLIDTLEAIKLFLAVPHVGFVIGADIRLVRYAIAARYSIEEGDDELISTRKSDLVTDYVEKLIQIPYYLPRLAPNEIETYVNLLFCQLNLEDENFRFVLNSCGGVRAQNRAGIFGYLEIMSALASNEIVLPQEEQTDLEWYINLSRMISPSLADILKGNPRQTKRLLNALLLRHELARVAGLEIDWGVLVKLMILEYVQPDLFSELYRMQARQQGIPKEIIDMESAVDSSEDDLKKVLPNLSWQDPTILNWLRMQPPLSQIDLRDYFWLTRDRISGILSGVSLIPPIIRTLLADIAGRQGVITSSFKNEIRGLQPEEQGMLFRELGSLLKRNQDNAILFGNWIDLGAEFPEAVIQLVSTLDQLPNSGIPRIAPLKLVQLSQQIPQAKEPISQLLAKWKRDPKMKRLVENAEQPESGVS